MADVELTAGETASTGVLATDTTIYARHGRMKVSSDGVGGTTEILRQGDKQVFGAGITVTIEALENMPAGFSHQAIA